MVPVRARCAPPDADFLSRPGSRPRSPLTRVIAPHRPDVPATRLPRPRYRTPSPRCPRYGPPPPALSHRIAQTSPLPASPARVIAPHRPDVPATRLPAALSHPIAQIPVPASPASVIAPHRPDVPATRLPASVIAPHRPDIPVTASPARVIAPHRPDVPATRLPRPRYRTPSPRRPRYPPPASPASVIAPHRPDVPVAGLSRRRYRTASPTRSRMRVPRSAARRTDGRAAGRDNGGLPLSERQFHD